MPMKMQQQILPTDVWYDNGQSLSPTIAYIVLDTLLDDITLELSKNGIQINLVTKYVNDILAIINNNDENLILNLQNS